MLATSLTVLVGVALAGLLASEARGAGRAAFYWKALASAGFVALAVVLGGWQGSTFSRWVLAGLVLAAGGDVALAVPGERSFFVGLVLFLLGHVAYVFACAARVPPSAWLGAGALVPVLTSGAAFVWLAPHLGSMRVPVAAYVLTITTMVAAASSVARAGGEGSSLLFAGAVLFYLSDLSVARDRFVSRAFVNRAWGLPAYYAGQVLMAWATG
jgi:uncharacterized membrane protein YhhN